jgi:omega-6 fatty acid desaturase (delta-12 desaturase)
VAVEAAAPGPPAGHPRGPATATRPVTATRPGRRHTEERSIPNTASPGANLPVARPPDGSAGTRSAAAHAAAREWNQRLAPFAEPDARRSATQLLTTVVPLAATWWAMALTVGEAYWLTLGLSVVAAAFLVRLFMIQHDCGHRSFFRSARINALVGHLIGVLTLTPHGYWWRAHNLHHATAGNLDRRGIGDVTTLTVAEYLALPRLRRLAYRLPLDLLKREHGSRRAVFGSVMLTNAAIAALGIGLGLWLGFTELLLLHAPVIVLSSAAGVWLFYIQHQYETVYWRRTGDWSFHDAALAGSSFYDLPWPLRWLTADIGIHHVHHLSSRIPNYRLRECLAHLPALPDVTRLTLRSSLRCLRLALYDEATGRMVRFKALRHRAG